MSQSTTLTIDLNLFDLDTIKKTIYMLPKGWSAELSLNDDSVDVFLSARTEKDFENVDDVVAKVQRDLIDQDLRKKISAETEGIRNLILSLAFSKTGLQS